MIRIYEKRASEDKVISIMKKLGIKSARMSSEHKGGADSYYGYIYVEHSKLGDIYISYKVNTNKIDASGYPWEFIEKDTSKEQFKFVKDNESDLNNITNYLSRNYSIEI